MKQLLVAITLALTCLTPAHAQMAWPNTEAQKQAVSKLSAGYAAGVLCDRLVDPAVAASVLEKAFGAEGFTASDMANFGKWVIGIVAVQVSMMGQDKTYCPSAARAFGPHGTVIPGLTD